MIKSMSRFTAGFLTLMAMLTANIFAAPTQFTAQVYVKKNGKMVENLTAQDFQLFENLREQNISKVERETQPLSIVLIPMLGEGQYCDTSFFIIPNSPPSNDMSKVADAFHKYLGEDDEFAMILPDKDATILRGFNVSNDDLMNNFAEFRRISDRSQVTISNETSSTDSMGMMQTSTESYSGVRVNYAENALDKSLGYLQTQAKEGNRQVVFFLRPFYNLSDLAADRETQLKQTIARQGTLFNWIGEDKYITVGTQFKFFHDLNEMTGSEREPCKLLKSNNVTNIQSVVSGMLSRLRTRYTITYTSNNQPSLGNLRQAELRLTKSGNKKAKGQVVISAPQIVFVDQNTIAKRF